ncbi:MAG: peptidyl-prolyl cis-trans isomerase [Anaerolineae bacterium]|nr:peptidyl-prolyl cis-trans isomerase [Anaerolineae bacterium]
MSEVWKQAWEDILNSIRGEAKSEVSVLSAVSEVVSDGQKLEADAAEHPIEDAPLTTVVVSPQEADSVAETQPAPAQSISTEREPEVPPTEIETARLWRRIRENAVLLIAIVIVVAVVWISSRSGSLSGPQPPAPDVIATFNGGQITIADLEAHLALLAPDEIQEGMSSPFILQLMVQHMVADELARQWADNRQPDNNEMFAHTMEHITEDINLTSFESQLHENAVMVAESEIQNYYYENREQFGDQALDTVRETIRQTLVAEREQGYIEEYVQRLKDNASIARNFELLDVPAPTEDDLRSYYDENVAQFTLPKQATVDELEFPIGQDESVARRQAEDALLSLRSGATFEQVAQENTSVILTTTLSVPKGSRELSWETTVFGLTEGEISSVFRAGNSFYIVRLIDFEDERTQTLEEARNLIMPVVQQQQTDIWFQENADRTLLTINGRRYTVGQFYREYQELAPTIQAQFSGSEGMRNLAEKLIERLLLVEDTYDQLLDSQNQPLIEDARLEVLKQMMDQEDVDDQIEVTDEEMRQFYDENQDLMAQPPEARIRYIRIGLGSSEDEAQRARERADEAYNRLVPGALQSGEDFAAIAREYSEDPETAANGGEFPGWIGESNDLLAEIELHPFHERVLTLRPGEISPIFEFGDSLYIVQVIERTEPESLTFEQARPYIQEILYQQEHEALTAQLENTLLEQAGLTIYPGVLESYFNQRPSP